MKFLLNVRRGIALLFFVLWILISYIIIFLFFPLLQTRFYDYLGRYVVLSIHMLILKLGFGLQFDIRNFNKIPKNGHIILALKHQTWLETFAIWFFLPGIIIFHRPNIILIGKYLDYIQPFLIGKYTSLKILRNTIRKAQKFISKHPKRWNKLVIFPEGTRRLIDDPPKYNMGGLYYIYKTFKYPIYPIAVNTGYFWPRNKLMPIRTGHPVMKCLNPILDMNLSKEELELQFVENLETASQELIKEAQEK